MERRPILASADGTIYGGNMRWRAAKHLGWPEVPVILDDVPEQLAKERSLRDNNVWSEWQEDELAELLAELKFADSDLEALGFAADRLNELLELTGIDGEQVDPRISLAERFGAPPFSVLDARQGYWQERKRLWLALGIASELGRGDCMPSGASSKVSVAPGGSPRPAASLGKNGRTRRGDGRGRSIGG